MISFTSFRCFVLSAAILCMAACTTASKPAAPTEFAANREFIDSLPYNINKQAMADLAALDPKKIELVGFHPDPDPKAQGLRMVSSGRIFPFVYEIISITDVTDKNALSAVSSSLDGHPDIVLKELKNNNKLGDYLHYFQRYDQNGKPHHVSSNYLYIKNNTLIHLAATSYGPAVMPRESWGGTKSDQNAEMEVERLLPMVEVK